MMNERKLLFIGDIVGDAGILTVAKLLPELREEMSPDIVIANGENAMNGRGIALKQAKELFKNGIDIITGGNHIFDREKVPEAFGEYPDRLLRPANFAPELPGKGMTFFTLPDGDCIAILNLQCRIFMVPLDSPFEVGTRLIAEARERTKVIFMDLHGEATAEKIGLARYFDGQVSAVLGTHTHVATADAEILPGGTAFQCDVGMTGPHDGVIGMETTGAINRLRLNVSHGTPPASGDLRLHATMVNIDCETGKAVSILPIQRRVVV